MLLQTLPFTLLRLLETIQGNPPLTREKTISQALATPQLQGLLHQSTDCGPLLALTCELKDVPELRIGNFNRYFHTCSTSFSDSNEVSRPGGSGASS